MNVMTRVRSAWYASTCRSNISFACSSNVGGMPAGWSTAGSSRALLLLGPLRSAAPGRGSPSRYSIELRRGRAPERPAQPGRLVRHRVENAAVLLAARPARPPDRCCRCRRTAARTRRADRSPSAAASSAAPRERVRVRAAVARVAGADRLARFERQLERRELGVRAEHARRRSDPSTRRPGCPRLRSSSGARRSGTRPTRARDRRRLRRAARRPACSRGRSTRTI